jgi:hypothetical protein
MPRKEVVPTQRWRAIRGGIGNYEVSYYDTKPERDADAQRLANLDTEVVLLEVWSADHPQDNLNQGWAMDSSAHPVEES